VTFAFHDSLVGVWAHRGGRLGNRDRLQRARVLMPGDSHVCMAADRAEFDFLSTAERAGRTRYNASRIQSYVIVHIGYVSAVLIFVVRARRATLKVALPQARHGSAKLVRYKRTKLFYAAACTYNI